jgi:hypothetical protein
MENAQEWDKVVARMVDPKMTKFRAMSLDEQTTTIEQLDQEALISREEMIEAKAVVPQVAAKSTVPQVATEARNIPPVASVQDKGFHMAPYVWERGFLMLEQAQWISSHTRTIQCFIVLVFNDENKSLCYYVID